MQTEVVTPPSQSSPERPDLGIVMVVDDEEQNRMLLRDPLEVRGYKVIEAENGIGALQRIEEQIPDVILLDLMMPKMDGFEVCRRLKKYWKSAHVPILVLTALSDRKERLMGIEAGANDFLTKPIDVQDVVMRVGNAVQMKRLHDQLQVEREKSEQLLRNILPKPIVERMKNGELNIAESHQEVTLLVADLAGFSALTSTIDPVQIVSLLNEIFSAFDLQTEKRGLEKIKISGDVYMAAGGIHTHPVDHAKAILDLALSFQEQLDAINENYGTSIRIRIGINTGPLVAGVIGRKTFAYDVWGETVNMASRLLANSEAGRIQVSESAYDRLKQSHKFETKHIIDASQPGDTVVHWLSVETMQ